MKIELEIGGNLKKAINDILMTCNYQADNLGMLVTPGHEIYDAFGIDFVELLKQDPELKNFVVETKKEKIHTPPRPNKIHNHPGLERMLQLDYCHVIIDADIFSLLLDHWDQVEKILYEGSSSTPKPTGPENQKIRTSTFFRKSA